MNRVVIESPLAGDTVRNFRFLLWCMRAVRLRGMDPIASHLIGPWFLNDADPAERALGMASEWVWLPGVPHWFFLDFGESSGMRAARHQCEAGEKRLPAEQMLLRDYAPDCWAAFERGEWPPHTPGFELAPAAGREAAA